MNISHEYHGVRHAFIVEEDYLGLRVFMGLFLDFD
jgi:hypothetical protein